MAEIRAWLSSHRQGAWWIVVLLAALAALWMLYVFFVMMTSYTHTPPPPPQGADGATPSNFPVELLFAEIALLAAAGWQYYKGQMGWSTLLLLLMFIGILFLGLENTQVVGHNLGDVLVTLTGGSIATMWIAAIVLLVFAYLRHKASKTDAVAWLVLAVVILFLGAPNVGTVGNNLGESLVEMTTKSAPALHEEPRKEAGQTDIDRVNADDLPEAFGEGSGDEKKDGLPPYYPGKKENKGPENSTEQTGSFLESYPKIKELVSLAAENPLVAILVMIGIGIFIKGWWKNDSSKGAIFAGNIAGAIAAIFALVVGLTFAFSDSPTTAKRRLGEMRDAIPTTIEKLLPGGGDKSDASGKSTGAPKKTGLQVLERKPKDQYGVSSVVYLIPANSSSLIPWEQGCYNWSVVDGIRLTKVGNYRVGSLRVTSELGGDMPYRVYFYPEQKGGGKTYCTERAAWLKNKGVF